MQGFCSYHLLINNNGLIYFIVTIVMHHNSYICGCLYIDTDNVYIIYIFIFELFVNMQ